MYKRFSFQHSKSLGVHGKVALRKIYRYTYAPIHLGSSVRPMLSMDRAPTKTPLSMTSQHQPLHQLTISTYQHCIGLHKEPTPEDSMLRHDGYCLVKGAKGNYSPHSPNEEQWPPTASTDEQSLGSTPQPVSRNASREVRW